MNKMRSKNNMILSPMSGIIRDVVSLRQKNIRSLFAFITDQRPPKER